MVEGKCLCCKSSRNNEAHGQSGCIYTRRGPVVAQIVITLDHDREKHRDQNRMQS